MTELSTEVVLRRLSLDDRRYVARKVGEEIVRRAQLEHKNALDIHKALVHFNVVLARAMSDDFNGAEYLPDADAESFLSTILVGIHTRDPRYVRALTHELAHHLQRVWVAPNLYDAEKVLCFDQDGGTVRHHISLLTERWVFDEDCI